jgi:Sensors of blue-light using FAD
MTSLGHIIYCSAASADFDEACIGSILEQSRANNYARGITGMLLYVQRCFFQVLEGDLAAINAVYGTIQLDPRHYRITRIIAESIVQRSFGEWTMGFSTLAPAQAGRLLGENDFFASAACVGEMNEGRAKKLLSAFKHGRWHSEATGAHRKAVRAD